MKTAQKYNMHIFFAAVILMILSASVFDGCQPSIFETSKCPCVIDSIQETSKGRLFILLNSDSSKIEIISHSNDELYNRKIGDIVP